MKLNRSRLFAVSFLVLALTVALLTVNVFADTEGVADVKVTTANAAVNANDTVVVIFSVDNITLEGGLLGIQIDKINYDKEVFDFVSMETVVPSEWTKHINGEIAVPCDNAFFALDETNFTKCIKDNGEFKVLLTLKVKESAAIGTTTISAGGFGFDKDLDKVKLNFGSLGLFNGIGARFVAGVDKTAYASGNEVAVEFALGTAFTEKGLLGVQIDKINFDAAVLKFKSLTLAVPEGWSVNINEEAPLSASFFAISEGATEKYAHNENDIKLTVSFTVDESALDDVTTVSVEGFGIAEGKIRASVAFNEAQIRICNHTNKTLIGAKEPDCTTEGYTGDLYCDDCGSVVTVGSNIDALGHDFEEEFTIDEEATSSKSGSKSKHCTRCDAKSEITSIPAQVVTLDDLKTAIANNSDIELTTDIDASELEAPIDAEYSANFNGKSHKITGLKVTLLKAAKGAKFTDLTIEGNITVDTDKYDVKYENDRYSHGIFILNAENTDFSKIVVKGSIATNTHSKGENMGGFVGSTKNCNFVNCINFADVTSGCSTKYFRLGGLVGSFQSGGSITNCANFGNITGSTVTAADGQVAGMSGYVNGAVIITGNFNAGTISYGSYCGGIVGYSNNANAVISDNIGIGKTVAFSGKDNTTNLVIGRIRNATATASNNLGLLAEGDDSVVYIDGATGENNKLYRTAEELLADLEAKEETRGIFGAYNNTIYFIIHEEVIGPEATCTQAQVCLVCGKVYAEAKGHTAGAEATCTEPQKCTVCEIVLEEAKGHTAGAEATCTEPQKCTVCEIVLAEAKGHTAGAEATCTEPQKCTVCGVVLAEAKGHTYGAAVETVKANCITKGEKQSTCTVCGEVKKEETETDQNNHVGGFEIKDAIEATTEAEGYTGDTYCSGCGVKLSSGTVIEKLAIVTQAPVTQAPVSQAPVTQAPATQASASEKKGCSCSCSSSITASCTVIVATIALIGTCAVTKKRK